MGKIESKARQARFAHQAKLGRQLPIQEVADAIGVDRKRLTQIELGRMKEIDVGTLAKLCEYYGVKVCDILEFDPSERRSPSLVPLAGVTY